MNSYDPIKNKVKELRNVTTRPMFGYQCFSISKKFFVGFSNKNNFQVIIRLPKDQQEIAIIDKSIKPFSHGAKTGWVELDAQLTTTSVAMKWISKGYDHAKELA